jgi:hypothetical protein
MKNVRFIGLDVHAETIAVAVAEPCGEVRRLGTILNRSESVRRLIGKLGKREQLRVSYEAGPTGYVLYWQLSELGVHCEMVAPTGDRLRVRAHTAHAGVQARRLRGSDRSHGLGTGTTGQRLGWHTVQENPRALLCDRPSRPDPRL